MDFIKLFKKDIKGKYNVKIKKGSLPIEKCGCTIPYPHSHLVMGFTCECEKGVPKSYQT